MDTQKRKCERKDVEFDAQVQIGDALMTGKVLDYSTHGMFFTPEESYFDGQFIHGAEALGELAGVGQCEVILLNKLQKPCVKMTANLRWLGQSVRHDCQGIGFEALVKIDEQPTADCEVIQLRQAA